MSSPAPTAPVYDPSAQGVAAVPNPYGAPPAAVGYPGSPPYAVGQPVQGQPVQGYPAPPPGNQAYPQPQAMVIVQQAPDEYITVGGKTYKGKLIGRVIGENYTKTTINERKPDGSYRTIVVTEKKKKKGIDAEDAAMGGLFATLCCCLLCLAGGGMS
eukprot:TRINITY_DN16594_c0_g1_i1.p1 TRINITY_DN16594_c0_g1~~TRINITY_DN16594_c0_g1_i1.p1  ORF type:complete len:172 (+),score=33.73 TRINITY_DN16594_c0_g1_i1:48-518(+)